MNNSWPSRQEAAKEALRRREARESLEHFTTYTYPLYRVEPAHSLLASTLERVVNGQLERLMIFAPPQHGKSELASVRLPAYWLGRRPDDPVILAAHTASLAEDKSRQSRQTVEGAAYHNLFPSITTAKDSRAVDHWRIDGHRGGQLAVGVGGPVLGHGAMLGIIDDPFKSWAEAQSQTIRDHVWEWWQGTFRTRIWEHGSVVLIMSRWHKDDLAGRLLKEQPGRWEVLRLPALAESQAKRDTAAGMLGTPLGRPDPLERKEGEPLCPKRFSKTELEALRQDVGSLVWAGQYNGLPTEAEGRLFKRDWFKRWVDIGDAYKLTNTGDIFKKADCVHFALVDPAVTEKQTNDPTAIGIFALTPARHRLNQNRQIPRLLVLHVVREWLSIEKIIPRAKEICDGWLPRPQWLGIEGVAGFMMLVKEALRTPGLPAVRTLDPKSKSKLVRAMAAIVRAEQGQIYIPERAIWLDSWIEEHVQFTGLEGGEDDQVDLTAFAAHQLAGEQDQQRGGGVKPYIYGN